MKYTYHENQEDKNGVISNTHGFLYRHLDTGFSSKWDGFWTPPFKVLDYFSFQVNGIWLNRENLEGVEYGKEMTFHYETDSLEIEETIRVPDGFPGFQITLDISNKTGSRKAVQTVLESGVDIRAKDEDVSTEDYSVERNNDRIIVSRKGKKLVIEPSEPEEFRGETYEKEHYPGERQMCLVPERTVFREEVAPGSSETVEVDFRTGDATFYEKESCENSLDHDLARAFDSSITSLENMVYAKNGVGIIAGHPWFQTYWARDSFWSLLGLIDAGRFKTSRKILENYVESGLEGKISLEKGGSSSNQIDRSDTAPLFIIAADKLRRHDGINNVIEEGMEEALSELNLEEQIAVHDPSGTWMDTLEREKAVDIQALWLEAARITDDERERDLKEGLQRFGNGDILEDELGDGSQTINPAVPLMFGQLSEEESREQLEKINGEFSSRYGARTRSVTDPGYDSSGYHTGSVWGLTTCWAAAANLEYGNDMQGVNFLQKLAGLLDRNQPGALPEVLDAESGELLGTPEQAWSAGLMVHVIDTYMLGIEVNDDHVRIDPAEITATRRGKKIRGEELDLQIEDGEVEVLNNPDLDLRF